MMTQYADEAAARAARDAKLAATDWTQLPDAERRITHLCVEQYQRYRRDVYAAKHQSGWPLTVDWPDEPELKRQEDVIASGTEPEII
jgi:hypothetical protein